MTTAHEARTDDDHPLLYVNTNDALAGTETVADVFAAFDQDTALLIVARVYENGIYEGEGYLYCGAGDAVGDQYDTYRQDHPELPDLEAVDLDE